jgi:hypothetical protein
LAEDATAAIDARRTREINRCREAGLELKNRLSNEPLEEDGAQPSTASRQRRDTDAQMVDRRRQPATTTPSAV